MIPHGDLDLLVVATREPGSTVGFLLVNESEHTVILGSTIKMESTIDKPGNGMS